ncbi:MAG: SMP-30/gluconolactonase/LRE family protein [Ideonella sp.]|nr:SMP-30/gluconolactonase/LRE family protein [Ideonella sp.]MCC7458972.1 SMP-30/gluconolactonase/LRE family protein [Nitrospira sp.]
MRRTSNSNRIRNFLCTAVVAALTACGGGSDQETSIVVSLGMSDAVPGVSSDLLGETPVWDAVNKRLLRSDIYRATIFAYDPASQLESVVYSGYPAYGMLLNSDSKLIVMGPQGMHHLDPATGLTQIIANNGSFFFNEAVADSRGRIYAGNVIVVPQPDGTFSFGRGNLYLIDTNGCPRIVDGPGKIFDTTDGLIASAGIGLSNGLGISPDNGTLYFADSLDRTIYKYDIRASDGTLANRKVFATIPRSIGIPDGLTVDTNGDVWVAVYYGDRVIHFDTQGKVVESIMLPAFQVSNVVFGGTALNDLYITSASQVVPFPVLEPPSGFPRPNAVPGGQLFRLSAKVNGRIEYPAQIDPGHLVSSCPTP